MYPTNRHIPSRTSTVSPKIHSWTAAVMIWKGIYATQQNRLATAKKSRKIVDDVFKVLACQKLAIMIKKLVIIPSIISILKATARAGPLIVEEILKLINPLSVILVS